MQEITTSAGCYTLSNERSEKGVSIFKRIRLFLLKVFNYGREAPSTGALEAFDREDLLERLIDDIKASHLIDEVMDKAFLEGAGHVVYVDGFRIRVNEDNSISVSRSEHG